MLQTQKKLDVALTRERALSAQTGKPALCLAARADLMRLAVSNNTYSDDNLLTPSRTVSEFEILHNFES